MIINLREGLTSHYLKSCRDIDAAASYIKNEVTPNGIQTAHFLSDIHST